MKRVLAEVINNDWILKGLERRRDINQPRPRDISGSWIIWLKCPEIASEAKPGQFIMVHCGREECLLPRPFSIHQVDDDGDIALFYAVWEGGKGTGWLSQRQKGDVVELLGPLGNGYSINPTSQNLLLIAGGIGIAPLCFLAQRAVNNGYRVKLLRGASGEFKPSGAPNPVQHYPEKLLPPGLEVETISSSPDGLKNMVIDLLRPGVVGWADQVFACGPMPMYVDMYRRKQELLKGKPVQVSLEVRMGCGLGICYGCTVKTKNGLKKVCQDGPVFDLDEILWNDVAGILPLTLPSGKQ